VKGYSSIVRAMEAAQRLRERGYLVRIEVRNGWYVLDLDTTTPPTNDNPPPFTAPPPEAA
jgi:hypothetical protein